MNSQQKNRIIAIAALTNDRVIGFENKLPWHLPEDLKFFKRTTLGATVLMGRLTFDSIIAQLGRPLPGRRNVILSKHMAPYPGIEIVPSVEAVLQHPQLGETLYVIGGAQTYQAFLPHCDELLLTHVKQEYSGDSFFPVYTEHFLVQNTLLEHSDFQIQRYVRRVNS